MAKKTETRTLLYDIETAPSLGYYFDLYREGNIVWNAKNWFMLSFSWKWLGESKTHVLALPDFKTYKKDKEDDKELVESLWKLFDEADIVIGHNSNSFDNKKTSARFIYHNLLPPNPFKQIDTKLVAKKYFRFDSNKLNDLGKYLGLGEKIQTGGFELWKDCMNGVDKAWDKMCKYNKQDVVLLEKVYYRMLPYITDHPNLALMNGETIACPNCKGYRLHKRGYYFTQSSKFQKWRCMECGSWHRSSLKDGSQIR